MLKSLTRIGSKSIFHKKMNHWVGSKVGMHFARLAVSFLLLLFFVDFF